MKINRILAGVLAGAVLCAGMPYTNKNFSAVAIFDAGDEDSELTYGDLTYCNYGDYIEITGCDVSATEVEIPSELDGVPVTAIGKSAFGFCESLYEITLPDSITSIGNGAFSFSGLKSITIPKGVTSISEDLFNSSKLEHIVLHDGITSIGDSAFMFCVKLEEIDIPESVTAIGDSAFSHCISLTEVIIPDTVESIGHSLFFNCRSLTKVSLPDNITSLGDEMFFACTSLTEYTIPDSVTSIGSHTFCGCEGLTEITIPENVASVGKLAFGLCQNLESITFLNPDCEIYDEARTISSGSDDEATVFYFDGTIYGYSGSTAQAYAEKYGRTFIALDDTSSETVYGDANCDGDVLVNDAVLVMAYATNPEACTISQQGLMNADVYQSGDGVAVTDAAAIQKYLTKLISALPES